MHSSTWEKIGEINPLSLIILYLPFHEILFTSKRFK